MKMVPWPEVNQQFRMLVGLPWRFSGQGSALPLQAARVRDLVREIGSHVPHGTAKNIKKRKEKPSNSLKEKRMLVCFHFFTWHSAFSSLLAVVPISNKHIETRNFVIILIKRCFDQRVGYFLQLPFMISKCTNWIEWYEVYEYVY